MRLLGVRSVGWLAPFLALAVTGGTGCDGGSENAASGNDAVVRVSNGGSGAQLAGVLSTQGGLCASCDADGGLGDAGCDEYVPN